MADETRGVYRKYTVRRTDGSSRPGRKHAECAYFVLDLDHDVFARPALEAYATACRETHPALARDIEEMLRVRPCGCRSVGECTHHWLPQTMSEMASKLMGEDDDNG